MLAPNATTLYVPREGLAGVEPAGGSRLMLHEWLTCAESPLYFVDTYCQIYDATARVWIPFKMWPAQAKALKTVHENALTVILKARQLGLSWLMLGYVLWLMLFRAAAAISLFSRRQEEAVYLLGPERLRGMYERLPEWMKARSVELSNDTRWKLSNGSMARAFPTSAGDSYTSTFALADEFDLVEDQGHLMTAVKPTIDGGGKMVLLSRADKKRPVTEFKQIYRAARAGQNTWVPIFLPWHVRPGRDAAWYQAQVQHSLSSTGFLDFVHEQYPETEAQALAPNSGDKRIPVAWLERCYDESVPPLQDAPGAPAIPELLIYRLPRFGVKYVIGADPAEGNPTSDDSSFTVQNKLTGEEVASLSGKFQPDTFAQHIAATSRYYNRAGVLPERNNHGHAVILALHKDAPDVPLLMGLDGEPGWLTTSASKAAMFDDAAKAFKEGDTTLYTLNTYLQLASIEGATNRAPKQEHDDAAIGFALALLARSRRPATTHQSNYMKDDKPVGGRTARDIWEEDEEREGSW